MRRSILYVYMKIDSETLAPIFYNTHIKNQYLWFFGFGPKKRLTDVFLSLRRIDYIGFGRRYLGLSQLLQFLKCSQKLLTLLRCLIILFHGLPDHSQKLHLNQVLKVLVEQISAQVTLIHDAGFSHRVSAAKRQDCRYDLKTASSGIHSSSPLSYRNWIDSFV